VRAQAEGDLKKRCASIFRALAVGTLGSGVHTARSIVTDLRTHGPDFLDKTFTGKREGTLWYYQALVEVFAGLDVPEALRRELEITVSNMVALATPEA